MKRDERKKKEEETRSCLLSANIEHTHTAHQSDHGEISTAADSKNKYDTHLSEELL